MKNNIFNQCLTKEEFINRTSVDIKNREQLREFFNTTFMEVIKRFAITLNLVICFILNKTF